jgi:hypothetical protein
MVLSDIGAVFSSGRQWCVVFNCFEWFWVVVGGGGRFWVVLTDGGL